MCVYTHINFGNTDYVRNITHTSIILLGIVGAAIVPVQASTLSTAFGQAADYNVFVFSSFSDGCCTVGGNLAAGGATGVNNFSVAQSQIVSAGQTGYYSYYNSGALTGNVYLGAGNAYYGLGVTGSGPSYPVAGGTGSIYLEHGGQTVSSTCTNGYSCIDFAAARTSLQSYSAFLSNQTNNATTVIYPGDGYTINATNIATGGDPNTTTGPPGNGYTINATNFATITAAQLASGALHINLVAGGTLVINVTPDANGAASTSNHGIFVNGTQYSGDGATIAESIVFNFIGTSFNTYETIIGTILAPYATVTGYNSQQIDGGLIAESFAGNSDFHDLLFQGALPFQTQTPEPAPFCYVECRSALDWDP